MRFSKRSAAVTLRLLLLTPMIFAFQNCNQKMGTDSNVSGEMTTHVAVDTPQFKLEDLIRGYYVNILGRQPTADELANAMTLLTAGLPGSTFQQQLANSGEAIAKITALLVQALGSSNNSTLTSLISLLENGGSLQQIRQLLGLPQA